MQWATRIFFVSLLIPVFLFAKVEIVNVEVEGIGSSKKAAIDSALVEAVSQVNGAEIASKTKRQLTEVVNDEDVKSSEAFNQEVSTITNGLIKNWKILSESLEGNNHLVKLSVNISKFKKSVQTDRLRLAVVPFRAADSVKVNQTVSKFEGAITAQLENYLTQTRRFALIDRSFLDEQTKELNLIAAGSTTSMSVDEIVKPKYSMDWEELRDRIKQFGLRHSTLSAIMPCESSSVIQNSTNGIEPVRQLLSYKKAKNGVLKQLVPNYHKCRKYYSLAFDMKDNNAIIKIVAVLQKFVDMSISANLYYNYDHYEDGSIPLSQIIKDNITSYKYGVKNLYYCNTPDGDGKLEKEPVCEGGACAI